MTWFRHTDESFRPGATSLPGDAYCSDAVFAAERERIFANRWICVGRETEISNPGDYFLAEVAAESILVVRDDQGAIAAHYNLCRHRGTRLCTARQGRLNGNVRCPYHGWTYDLSGRLLAAPQMEGVAGFDRARLGLHPVHVATCGGFVFLNLADAPDPFASVEAAFARFDRWGLDVLRAERRIDYDVAANWKLVVENYSECYHCPLVHPSFSRLVHHRSGHNDAFEGAMLGGYMQFTAAAASLTPSGERCGPTLGTLAGEDLERVYFYAFFPNLTISLHPDYVMAFLIEPLAPARTRVRCEWLFPAGAAAAGACRPDEAVAFWDPTNREDWEVCALVQQGVGSRAYGPSPLSSAESLPEAFNRYVTAALS